MKIALKGLTFALLFGLFQQTFEKNGKSCSNCHYEINGIKLSTHDLEALSVSANPLCRRWQGNSCVQCSHRSWMNKQGYCVQVDPNCNKFDQNVGICISCYPGYHIDGNGICSVERRSQQVYSRNPFCAKWENGICVACGDRSFFSKDRICRPIDPNCKKYDKETGECKQCYQGYEVSLKGTCQVSKPKQNAYSYNDPLCAEWNYNGQCVRCADRSYFGKDGNCVAVDPLCKKFKQGHGCVDCYDGYSIINGKCIIARQVNEVCLSGRCDKAGGNTRDQNSKGSVTIKRDIKKPLQIVSKVDKYCWTFKQGKCSQCFPGFSLDVKGSCFCQK